MVYPLLYLLSILRSLESSGINCLPDLRMIMKATSVAEAVSTPAVEVNSSRTMMGSTHLHRPCIMVVGRATMKPTHDKGLRCSSHLLRLSFLALFAFLYFFWFDLLTKWNGHLRSFFFGYHCYCCHGCWLFFMGLLYACVTEGTRARFDVYNVFFFGVWT